MKLQNLARLVQHYQEHGRLDDHLGFYRNLPTLECSIETAAMARLWNGKRHSHQRRIPGTVLERVKNNLLERQRELERAADFDGICRVVEECRVAGFGELAIYDTALRIGVRLGKLPDRVYLHAGTRKGLKALGLDGNRKYIELKALPWPLRQLSASAVEDFLCIHKDRLARIGDADDFLPRLCQPQEAGGVVEVGDCAPMQLSKGVYERSSISSDARIA